MHLSAGPSRPPILRYFGGITEFLQRDNDARLIPKLLERYRRVFRHAGNPLLLDHVSFLADQFDAVDLRGLQNSLADFTWQLDEAWDDYLRRLAHVQDRSQSLVESLVEIGATMEEAPLPFPWMKVRPELSLHAFTGMTELQTRTFDFDTAVANQDVGAAHRSALSQLHLMERNHALVLEHLGAKVPMGHPHHCPRPSERTPLMWNWFRIAEGRFGDYTAALRRFESARDDFHGLERDLVESKIRLDRLYEARNKCISRTLSAPLRRLEEYGHGFWELHCERREARVERRRKRALDHGAILPSATPDTAMTHLAVTGVLDG